ncbi:hypothetical protein BASA81_012426 [Batrachochytrium salamandrivorans]|nr:hypothetical protein BASA81_012426 [Batrachochytrium salamandrivorans]
MEEISQAKLLLVGAGGIGCELLKTLVQSGFRSLHVVDLDTIDVSNLNRQFLFRKQHVGQSKALVACEVVRQFIPHHHPLELVPHHANIKDTQFDKSFFDKFDLVLNALDNVNARQHVNRMCLASNLPLVDAGTTGYLGQTCVIKRGETQCFDCEPKKEDKSMRFPICTIRSTPDRPVHCIVWAKELFKLMFGNPAESDLIDLDENASSSIVMRAVLPFQLDKPDEAAYPAQVFLALFHDDIAQKKEMRKSETYTPSLLKLDLILQQPVESSSTRQLWSLRECWNEFDLTTRLLLERRRMSKLALEFDKDDDVAMRFVCAAANLRCEVFHITRKSLFDVKGIAGNIIHAIATTNAIVAGIQVLEAIRLLTNGKGKEQTKDCRLVWVNRAPSSGGQMLLMPCKLDPPEPQCLACGKAELVLFMDLERATFENVVVDVLTKRLGLAYPMVTFGANLLFEVGEGLDQDEVDMYNKNLKKKLSDLPGVAKHGSAFDVLDLFQTMTFRLVLSHREAKVDAVSGEMVGELFEVKGEKPQEPDAKRTKVDVPPEDDDDIEIL